MCVLKFSLVTSLEVASLLVIPQVMVLQKASILIFFAFLLILKYTSFYTAPGDYTAQSGSFAISSSTTSECISISIISDLVQESGQECFIVNFFSSSSDFTLKAPSVATICISDGWYQLNNAIKGILKYMT